MQEQLAFSLTYRPAFGRSDFLISACNQEAVTWIDRYPDWSSNAFVICGEKGSGKSHLASIFSQTQIDASSLTVEQALSETAMKVVVEDIDLLRNEAALFHLYNNITARNGALLMTATRMPVFRLKDLQSRFNSVPKVFISMPDEELLSAVLTKAFYDRHLYIDLKVIDYALARIPRSFESVQRLIEEADLLSLQRKQRITIPLMRQVLDNLFSQKEKQTIQPDLFGEIVG